MNKFRETKSNYQELKSRCHEQWMQPRIYQGSDIEEEVLEAGLDLEYDKYYARLSASGFLDCTDWRGPFDDMETACGALLEAYYD